jgi:hypothetical protein
MVAENVDDFGVIRQSRMVMGRGFKYFLRFEARFAETMRSNSDRCSSDPITLVWPAASSPAMPIATLSTASQTPKQQWHVPPHDMQRQRGLGLPF